SKPSAALLLLLLLPQLEAIKAARGLHVDDGTIAADKPLAEILADKKKAKQDAFDDQWKQMKTGDARPAGHQAERGSSCW
ncbi:hypothetical protein IAI27_11295, partial [Streptococcus pseudopneumoniae]|uniref:hypothetical protein n=1 Tax=Streptococcus pseudopneumoniae TaxID=257758 RepID=UPI0018B0D1B5